MMCDYDRYITQDVFHAHCIDSSPTGLAIKIADSLHKIRDYALIHEFHVMGPICDDAGMYHATLLVIGDEDKGHGTSRAKNDRT
jgi:hypothetical protein